jgi:hypothetical protein
MGKTLNNGMVKFYTRNKSHVSVDNYINIWNEGTNEYTAIKSHMDEILFNPVLDVLKSCAVSERGNVQTSFGFSQQNQNGWDEDTHVNKPQANKNTDIVIPHMLILTKLTKVTKTVKWMTNSKRTQTFAARLHKLNKIEGCTLVMTDLKNVFLVNCHVDKYICAQSPHNYSIIASSIGITDGKLKQLAVIGYGRKSIGDYMKRVDKFQPVVDVVQEYIDALDNNQKSPITDGDLNRLVNK